MKIVDDQLVKEEGDAFQINFIQSPNVNPLRQQPERKLILHATEGPDVGAAVGFFKKPKIKGEDRSGLSIHLVVGKDGKEIVQMLSFDKGANHAADFNNKSIGIELDYPGALQDSPTAKEYKKLSNYPPESYLYASALNDSKYKFWPLYPREQLDGLVKICRTLANNYDIQDIVGHEELYSYKLDPGPAFPIVQFRERLKAKGRASVLQETVRVVRVRNRPGQDFVFLRAPEIPERTPVTIINEYTDEKQNAYCLISVVAKLKGNPWIIGWVERDAVAVKSNQTYEVDLEHYLTTDDDRRFQIIAPHPNGFHRRKLLTQRKYIIIHFTTGTRVESTIAHFRSEASGVSAHLLISSDGRIIQFLPFNKIAFHAGLSWWEPDKNLNEMSIGIELDNAGSLTKTGDKWFRKDIQIPNQDVVVKEHEREGIVRGWENFPQVQLNVLENVVRGLVEHYGSPDTMEMLGHDDVNIANRLDPGPAFPMDEIRMKVFGRPKARFRPFKMNRDAIMYENVGGGLPNIKQRKHDARLPEDSVVTFIREVSGWTLIAVHKNNKKVLRNTRGWVRSRTLEFAGAAGGKKKKKNREAEDRKKVVQFMRLKKTTDYHRAAESPPSPPLPKRDFKGRNPDIRIEEIRDQWALVVLLNTKGAVEGWVEKKFIIPPPDEQP